MSKKISIILAVLLLVIMAIALVACNTTPPPSIIIDTDETPKATNSVSKQYAWERIYNGIQAIGSPDETFLNFDTAFYFTYQRDGVGSIYYLRAKGSIDVYDDTKSKLAIEIGEDKDGAGEVFSEELLLGIYYTYSDELKSGLLYADMTALAGGTKVMKITDINLSQFAQLLSKTMSKLNLSGTIEDLLNMELLGNSIVTWISGVLFGECQVFDNGNGKETIHVTLDITDLLGIVLGVANSFLADYNDVLIAIRDATGIDLTDLNALIPAATGAFSVELQNGVFSSMDFGLNIYYPNLKNPDEIVTIQLGIDKLEIGVVPDVEFPDIPEENLVPFSLTTISLDVQAYLTTSQTTITISGVEDAFGTLLTSLLSSVANSELANKPITFNTATYSIDLKLRAELNLTNNDKTNILCELYGGENNTLRAGIYYVGTDKTLYVDLSGIIGEGARYKIEDLDIVELIWTSLNKLIDGIGAEAESGATTTPAQKVGAFFEKEAITDMEKGELALYVENLITSGQVTQQVLLSGNGEATTAAVDLGALITAVLASIEIQKGDGLFSIDRITMKLTKEVITSIVGMFSDGAELPIEVINIDYQSEGFMQGKKMTLAIVFDGILDGFSANLDVDITYGSLKDENEMRSTLTGVSSLKNTYLNFSEDGGLDIQNIYVSLEGEFNLSTINGDITTITYQDLESATTTLLQLLLRTQNSNNVNLNFSIKGNLNLKDFLSSEFQFVIKDDDGTTYLEIYFSDKTVYLDASYFGLQKVKVDISTFIKSPTDEGTGTADGQAEEESGGLDIMALIASVIGELNFGTNYVEVLLADRVLTTVLSVLDSSFFAKLQIEGEEDLSGGVRIVFNDGLNLNLINAYIFASSGANIDIGLTMGNLAIGLTGESIGLAGNKLAPPDYITATADDEGKTRYNYNEVTGLYEAGYGDYVKNEYADFSEDPTVWFSISGGMSLVIGTGQIDLSSGLEQLLGTIGITSDFGIDNITIEEPINETFSLNLQANLDLEPLIRKLQGREYTTIGNQTQFLLELTRNLPGGATETIFGIYYRGGILYLDIATMGIDKVAIEFDMFELIMELLYPEEEVEEDEEATGTAVDFSTTYKDSLTGENKNYDFALLLALTMSDENFVLSIADGLTQLVLNKLGFGFPEIVAELEFRWRDSEDTDIDGDPIYKAGMYLYGAVLDDDGAEKIALRLDVSQPEISFETHDISKTVFGAEYTKIQLYDEDGNIGIPGVYLETTGYIQMTAFNNDLGENDWEVGDWLKSIIDLDNAGLDTLLKQLVFGFDVHTQIESILGFKVALMLRLDNTNANINDPDFSIMNLLNFDYILTHSDLAVEIWDGVLEVSGSKKIVSVYLMYEGENAFGVPYSTLYLDIDTNFVSDIHVKIDGFSLANLLTPKESFAKIFELTTTDTTATWTPFDTVTEEVVTFTSSNGTVATAGDYVDGILTINLLGVAGTAVITAKRGEQIVTAQVKVSAPVAPQEPTEPEEPEKDDTLGMIATIIAGGISSITINEDELMINLGAKLVGVILGLFLPDIYYFDEDGNKVMNDMVELNPDRSFIALNWTTKELVASVGVDPLSVVAAIDGVNISLYERSVAEINVADYTSLTDLTQFSLSIEVSLEFELKQSEDPIKIDDYLKAFIANIALDFGIEITDDIYAGLSLEIEANLNLNNIEGTEVFMQLVNNNTKEVLLGIYLVGDKLYINMGMLSEHNVMLENISVAQIVNDALNGLVSKVTTTSEATGTGDEGLSQERALDIVFGFAKNEISLTVTQNLIIALITFLVNNNKAPEDQINLDSIFYGDNAIADLGMQLDVIIDTSLPSIALNFDSDLFSLSATIAEPFLATKLNPDRYVLSGDIITDAESWNGLFLMHDGNYIEIAIGNRYTKDDSVYNLDPEGNFVLVAVQPNNIYVELGMGTVKYSKRVTTSTRIQDAIAAIEFNSLTEQPNLYFNVDFYFNYSLDATYTLLTLEEASKVPASERFTRRVSDGYFVQDDDGLYQKIPTEFQTLLDAVLNLNVFADMQKTVVKKGRTEEFDVTLGDLLARLALQIYVDDPIDQLFKLSLFGNVDLEKLGIMGLLAGELKFSDLDFSLDNLLEAIELGLTLTAGRGENAKQIKISFVDQLLYVDLTAVDGPRFKIDIMSMLMPETDEALSTDDIIIDNPTVSKVSEVLNAIVKVAVIKSRSVIGGMYNELDSFNVYFNSDLLPSLISLFTTGSVFDMSKYALDESASGLFVKFSDEEYGGPSISMVLRSIEGFEIKMTMAAGMTVDIGTAEPILTMLEKKQYADLTDFSNQNYNLSVTGSLHFGADSAETYNLSGLLASWFGDMLFELESENAFEDALAFRLSANANLADIYIEYLTGINEYVLIGAEENYNGDRYIYDSNTNTYIKNTNGTFKLVNNKPSYEEFLANSNLDTLEIALEVLEVDSHNEIKLDGEGNPMVLGGIYLFGGALYLDGSNIFEHAPVSYVPNVFEIIGGLMQTEDEAVGTADDGIEINPGNDAVLALMISDPAIQLCLTKSFISILLGLLVPELGSMDEIFDVLDITLSFNKGLISFEEIDLSKIWMDDRYSHYYEDEEGGFGYINGEFVTVDATYSNTRYSFDAENFHLNTVGEYRVLESEDYILLDFDEAYDGTKYNYTYSQANDGGYLKIGDSYFRIVNYSRYDTADFSSPNPDGNYIYVNGAFTLILAINRYNLGFVAVPAGEDGEYRYDSALNYYIKLYKGDDGAESSWTDDRYSEGYFLDDNGNYVNVSEVYYPIPLNRYSFNGTNYVYDESGKFVFITAIESYIELTADNVFSKGFYLNNSSGEYKRGEASYVMILPYNERYKEVVTYSLHEIGEYKLVGGEYVLIANGESYVGDRYSQNRQYYLSSTDIYNPEYAFMRISNRFHSIADYGISLDFNVGTFSLGLEIKGLGIGFGETRQFIPQELVDNARPFYESTINIATNIDLKLSLTAGTIDLGEIFYAILGDLDGVVIEAPEYGLGETALHLRAKVDLKLDMYSLANSELSLEFYMVTGVGYEDLWFGLYYQGDVLYIDASKLNFPKICISEGNFAEELEAMLGKYLGRDIYTEEELEASGTDDSEINYDTAASILLDSKKLTISIGEDLVYYVLKLIKLGETPLYDLVYGGLNAAGVISLKLDPLNINQTEFSFDLGMKLASGDDYIKMSTAELAQTDTSADDYIDPQLRYKFEQDTSGLFKYDESVSAYVKLYSTQLIDASLRFSPRRYGTDSDDMNIANYTYKLIAGEPANFDNYEKELLLNLSLDKFMIAFDLEHEFKLSPEDVATYTEYKEIEHLTLHERVTLTTLFEESSLDLTEWVRLFFSDTDISQLQGLINVDAEGEGVLRRDIYLDINIDVKIAAIINIIRRAAATSDLTEEQIKKWVDGDMDILALFDLFTKADIDIVELSSYLNASIVISSETPTDGLETLLGVYIQGGYYKRVANYVVAEESYTGQRYSYDPNEITGYIEDNNGIYKSVIDTARLNAIPVGERYSHYFENQYGAYVYSKGEYVLADANSVGTRYSYDSINFYPNALGEYERIAGGTYVDMTYFGIPYIYLNSGMLREIFVNLTGETDEVIVADEEETQEEESKPITFPLLAPSVTQTIKDFIWGMQITTSYVSIVLQASYLNAIADLATDEDTDFEFYFDFNNRSYLRINSDRTRYRYEEITDESVLSDADVTKYLVTQDLEGAYVYFNGYAVLKGSLSTEQLEDITGTPFNVVAVTQEYVDANPTATFNKIIVENDEDVALIETLLYVFNHKLQIQFSFFNIGAVEYGYTTDGASTTPGLSRYARTPIYGDDDGTMAEDAEYHLLVGENYFVITDELRYEDEFGTIQSATGDWLKIGESEFASISENTVKRVHSYRYTQDYNGEYIRKTTSVREMLVPRFEENPDGNYMYDEESQKYVEIINGYEGERYSVRNYIDLEYLSKMSVTLEGSFNINGEHSKTPLKDVLFGLVGDMSSFLTVGISPDAYSLEIGFAAAVNLDMDIDFRKIGTGVPASEIVKINNLEIAIDLWRVNEDDTITNLIGLYYYNGYLYADISYILAEGGKVSVYIGELAIEDLINSLFEPEESDEAISTALVGADRALAGFYVTITRNNVAASISVALVKLIAEKFMGEGAFDSIYELLPNAMPYVSIGVRPMNFAVGAKLFDEEGTVELLDINFTVYGFDSRSNFWIGNDSDTLPNIYTGKNATNDLTQEAVRNSYTKVASLNLDALIGDGEGDSFTLDLETIQVEASLEIEANVLAGIINWSPEFSEMLGQEVFAIISALAENNTDGLDSRSMIDVSLIAFINVANFMDEGKTLVEKLAGTKIQLSMLVNSTILPWSTVTGEPQDIVVNLVLQFNLDGTMSLYLDLEDLGVKMGLGTSFAKLKFENLDLTGLFSSSGNVEALSAGEEDEEFVYQDIDEETPTGILSLQLFNIFNSIVRELQFSAHKLSINFRNNMIDSLLAMLSRNPTLQAMVDLPKFDNAQFAIITDESIRIELDLSVAVAEGQEYVLIEDYYPTWQGEKFDYNSADDIYTVSETGTYMKPSDLNVSLRMSELGVKFNLPDSGIVIDPEEYVDLDKMKINLSLEGSFGLYAAAYTQDNMQNVVDLSGLFELIFAGGSLAGTDLDLRINDTIDLVYNFGLYTYIDLEDLSTLELALSLTEDMGGGNEKTVMAVYLAPVFVNNVYKGHDIYIDLNIILGEKGKLSIKNFDLKTLLNSALGGLLGLDEASSTSLSTASGLVNALLPTAIIALRPEYLGLLINAKAVNAILEFFKSAEGLEVDNVFPDIGDLLIEIFTADDNKIDVSLNLKVNDSFYGSLDLTELTLENSAATGNQGRTGHLPTPTQRLAYTAAYDIATGEVLLDSIGLSFDGSLAITSQGYKVGDADYEKTFNYWLGGMIDGLLESLMGTPEDFATASNFEFTLPNGNITFDLKAKLDLNLKALMSGGKFNLGGIVYSDLAIEIYFGAPINTLAIGIYYLGSTRVIGSNFNYVVAYTGGNDYADYIYLDLTSFGLGKLKLSGIIGMLGGTGIQKATPTADASTTASDLDVRTVESISAEVIVEENKIAVNFNNAVITRLLGLLDLSLEEELPIETVQIDIEFDDGLSAIILNANLDSVGTALSMSLNNLDISFNTGTNKLINVVELVDSTSYGYAGLSLGTGGVGGLLNNLIESLDPSMKMSLHKLTKDSIILTDHNSWQTKQSLDSGRNNVSTIAISLVRGPRHIQNETSNFTDPHRLILGLNINHPMRGNSKFAGDSGQLYTLTGYVDSSNVIITGLSGVLDGLDWLINLIGFKNLDLGEMLGKDGTGNLLNLNDLAKGDNDYYNYPTAGDIGGVYNNNKKPDPAKIYTWSPDTSKLIKGTSINLWNTNGYTPYKDGSTTYTAGTPSARYSSIKLELDKDAFNDLLCFVYYKLIDAVGENLAVQLKNVTGQSNGTVEGILRGFEAKTTPAARRTYMTPFANAFGVSLIRSLISSYDGWITGAGWLLGAGGKIAGLSLVTDSIFPLPWATVNPTVHIYIDSMASGASGDISSVPGVQSIEIYVNATATSILNTNQYMRLIIQPSATNEKMLSIVEVDTISKATGEINPPTAITITDPAQRRGTMSGGTAGTKSVYLTAEYFTNPLLFPQRANVTFIDGTTNNKGSGGMDDLGGAHISWDASAVNMSAATSANDWLAGYVYGYVMGKVAYRIPVRVSNAYEVTAIKGYYKTGSTWAAKTLAVDMNTNSGTFNLELPDEVRITFRAGGTKTFTTHFEDDDYLTNYLPNVWGYVPPATESADSNATAQYPAGLLTWNYSDFEYDLVGGNVKVYYTYQWGLSNSAKNFVVVPIKNYKVATITKFNSQSTTMNNFTSFNAFNLADYMTGEQARDFDLAEYISSFTNANGKYANYEVDGTEMFGSSYSNLDLTWDLTNLEKAMEKLKNEESGGWDYYKGLDVNVTAYLGGMTFAAGEYFKHYPKASELDEAVYFDEEKGYVYVRQPITVRVKVESRLFNSFVKKEIEFNPYMFDTIAAPGAVDNEFQVNFKINGVTAKRWVTNGVDMTMTLPQVDESLISYRGYAGNEKDLFATVTIGKLSGGYQVVKLPIKVRNMTASTKNLTISDTFNPEWYEEFSTLDFSFPGGTTHTMQVDWSTLRLFSRSTYTSAYELTGEDKNIYSGGTKYALAEAYLFNSEGKELGLYNGKRQQVKFMLNVRTKNILSIYHYDGIGDPDSLASYNAASYTVNPLAYDNDNESYFNHTGYGNENARVKIVYLYNGVQQEELAYVNAWDITNFNPKYDQANAIVQAKIGSQLKNVAVAVQTKIVDTFSMEGCYVWNNATQAYEYNPLVAFSISDRADTVKFADGTTLTNVPLQWNDYTAPTTAELNAGSFNRTLTFFPDSDIMRQEIEITVNVLYYSELTISNPSFEGTIKPYYLFGELNLPKTVTFLSQSGTEHTGVPITWDSYELPSETEIIAGKFTRNAVIISTDKYPAIEQEFTIYSDYRIAEFTKVDGVYAYTLQQGDFYKGLPTTLTAVYGYGDKETRIKLNAEWLDVSYGVQGMAATETFVKLSANGFETITSQTQNAASHAFVNLTVEAAQINEFVDASTFVYDPFNLYDGADKLFASGSEVEVKVGGMYADGELIDYSTLYVKATYSLPDDILNSAKYYGKTIAVEVTFDYFTGKATKMMNVAVVDRSVTRVTNPLYRSVIIDPYDVTTFEGLPTTLNGRTANANEMFDFTVTWPSDDIITMAGGKYTDYQIKFVYKLSDDREAVQYVNIPITIINRTVVGTQFVISNQFEEAGTINKKDTLTYVQRSVELSQIVQTVYDKATSQPTTITFSNPFNYDVSMLPTQVVLTFADGEKRTYNITWDNLPNTVSSVDTTRNTVTANIWSYLSTEKPILKTTLELVVRAFKVTRFNSDIASPTLDNNFRYQFYPYADFNGTSVVRTNADSTTETVTLKNAFNLTNYNNSATLYIDGQWVLTSKLSEYPGYTRLTEGGVPIAYSFDSALRSYVKSAGGAYSYVYSVTQTLDIEWDLERLTYTYEGGTRYIDARFDMDSTTKQSVRVPIVLENQTLMHITYTDANFDAASNATTRSYFLENKMLDPWSSYDYTGDDAKRFFPVTGMVKFTSDDGTTSWEQLVDITWNLSGVSKVYTGGTFAAKAIVNGAGEYNYDNLNVRSQIYSKTVEFINRTGALSEYSNYNNAIRSLSGYVTIASGVSTTWIDPYNYSTPVMPTGIYIDVANESGTITRQYFYETSSTYKLSWDFNSFRPNYTGGKTTIFAVLTVGDSVQRVPIDFNVKRKYVYLVKGIVNGTTASSYSVNTGKTGNYFGYFNTVSGLGSVTNPSLYTYYMSPFYSATYKLPISYNVTFKTWTYNSSTGFSATTDESRVFSYATVTMPAAFEYGWTAVPQENAYNATIKFGSQQYVTIPVAVYGASVTAPTTPSFVSGNGAWIGTQTNATVTVNGTSTTIKVPVAWYGVALVYDRAKTTIIKNHPVSFSSTRDTMLLPEANGRQVVYVLRGVVGTMIDPNGNVLTTRVATEEVWENSSIIHRRLVAIGDIIPRSAYSSAHYHYTAVVTSTR